jgi:hypothetical protein
LTRLDISTNALFDDDGTPAGKAISDMLAANSTLKELDVSSNARIQASKGGPSFAQAISVGIRDNGALTSLNLSSNYIKLEGAEIVAAAVKVTNCVIAVVFGTIFMSIWPLAELLLFTAIHRITRH